MSQYAKDDILTMRATLLDIPEEARSHAYHFSASNIDLSETDFVAKWEAEMTERAGIAEREELRQLQVIADFQNIPKEVVARIVGAQASATAETAGASSGNA